MRRILLQSPGFMRAARRLIKKNPGVAPFLHAAMASLAEDAHHPALRAHKLKGELAGSCACSVSHNLRIIFEFVQHEGAEAILLESVGTHDEVY